MHSGFPTDAGSDWTRSGRAPAPAGRLAPIHRPARSFALGVAARHTCDAPSTADTATCKVPKSCDSAGACRASREHFDFAFEPVKVKRSGEGTWRLTCKGRSLSAECASEYGPFLWAEGSRDIQSLMVSDDHHMLWHSARESGATIRFMTCEE